MWSVVYGGLVVVAVDLVVRMVVAVVMVVVFVAVIVVVMVIMAVMAVRSHGSCASSVEVMLTNCLGPTVMHQT